MNKYEINSLLENEMIKKRKNKSTFICCRQSFRMDQRSNKFRGKFKHTPSQIKCETGVERYKKRCSILS